MDELDPDEDEEFKTRRLTKQGGSVMTSLPGPLVKELAKELNVSIVDLIKNYDLSIRVTRGKRGLLDGFCELTFVERGTEAPEG